MKVMSNKGFSIVELLVVTMVFTMLAILATQSIFLTLRGSRKSEAVVSVRENVDYAFAVMERQIRNAESVDCPDDKTLNYVDEYGQATSFSCETSGDETFIASGSASNRLTNPDVNINCSVGVFTCTAASGGVPPFVKIDITAESAESISAEGSRVTTSTRVLLRSY